MTCESAAYPVLVTLAAIVLVVGSPIWAPVVAWRYRQQTRRYER